ncbi:MAG: capsule biosynthesis protein CapA [Pseudomonadota bacterium]
MIDATGRHFLFLQGPHGPFFHLLAGALAAAGADVQRVAFNAADEREWSDVGPLHRFNDEIDAFGPWLEQRFEATAFTDIVIYGDTRPIHRIARAIAEARGLTVHCLEEGYVRPSWITYERAGNNGNSRLMSISLPRMAEAMGHTARPEPSVPATWGDANQHLWYSAWYHAHCLLPSRRFSRFHGHRDMPLFSECATYWLRAAKMPFIWARRTLQQRRLLNSDKPFHLVMLQLSFDASMQVHSDYPSTAAFVEEVITAFASSAPKSEHLVLKAHPFEDGRERLGLVIRDLAFAKGVADRVHFIDGGKKLAPLLDRAQSAITVNSTAAQQALWRGMPVAALGRAIYKKPGLVSEQTLSQFMAAPSRPNLHSYWLFRRFLMETSQIAGSFYASAGIELLLQRLPSIMIAHEDPYDRVLDQSSDSHQPLEAAPAASTAAG